MNDIIDDIYEFDREFRLKILSLMLDDMWMSKFGNYIIKPEYFERDDEEYFVKLVLEYREKYSKSPRDFDDLIALSDGTLSSFILDIYDWSEDWDTSLASDFAVKFAQEQAAKLAILESVDDVVSGDIKIAIDRMRKALEVGRDLTSPGIDPIGNVDDWLYSYWLDKVPTRMTHVDVILEGGLGAGEQGIVLAPVNRGKSMVLINFGYGAASIGSRRNVIHFTHEMSVEQVAKRYAARVVFRFPKKHDDLDLYAEELVDSARRILTGNIRIIGGAHGMSTHMIENHIDRLIDEGFEPGLIIDDYPDLIEPPRQYAQHRFELRALFKWFREIAGKYNCPVWGASQANRAAFSKEIITLENMAEDIQKAAIADVVIGLCQTYEEEEADTCRLYMAKVRDSKKHAIIKAKFYGEQQAIITVGQVKRDDKRGKNV